MSITYPPVKEADRVYTWVTDPKGTVEHLDHSYTTKVTETDKAVTTWQTIDHFAQTKTKVVYLYSHKYSNRMNKYLAIGGPQAKARITSAQATEAGGYTMFNNAVGSAHSAVFIHESLL